MSVVLDVFKKSVPVLAKNIKEKINNELQSNTQFKTDVERFYQESKAIIGENLNINNIIDIMTQHIITASFFSQFFQNSKNNKFNNSLNKITNGVQILFKEEIEKTIKPYYESLSFSLKNAGGGKYLLELLRSFYENFYQAWDVKAADKMGVVYTPVEAVSFMVRMADILSKEHFNKHLYEKDIHILDPCTGTGSFMVELIDYIYKNAKNNLEYKYKNDLHANELNILAYYIGNLYIELVYESLTKDAIPFNNMVYCDTLEDDFFSKKFLKEEENELQFLKEEEEVKEEEKIKIIIGNPPYNVGQKNENQNNKNKAYKTIDERIKKTYVKLGSAGNKNTLYDMYVRFIRWASDRIEKKGMVAFITNRSFLDAHSFDGFRKIVCDFDFTHIYSIDLGGDIRKGGQGENIFNIMTGVAITFFIKAPDSFIPGGFMYLNPFKENTKKREKLDFLKEHTHIKALRELAWQNIKPNSKNYWLNQSQTNFNTLTPLGDKKNRGKPQAQSIFILYSLGVGTGRDSWVYDKNKNALEKKIKYFINIYENEIERWKNEGWNGLSNKEQAKTEKQIFLDNFVNTRIKWSESLKKFFLREYKETFNKEKIVMSLYRPFNKRYYYMSKVFTNRLYQLPHIFPTGDLNENKAIGVSGTASSKPFMAFIVNIVPGSSLLEVTQIFPLYRYVPYTPLTENQATQPNRARIVFVNTGQEEKKMVRESNITAGAINLFNDTLKPQNPIIDEDIFNYIYAILHHPLYRETYKIDLTQNLPAVPISCDFFTYVELGKKLMDLHLNFNNQKPFNFKRVDVNVKRNKIKLKSYPCEGIIIIDDKTTLNGIDKRAWDYRLGNRSAIDWVLEGYKIKKINPDDGDIGNPYSELYTVDKYPTPTFTEEEKEECIKLVASIITLSLKTLDIIEEITPLSIKDLKKKRGGL